MPQVTSPNVIELSDFHLGWQPDLEPGTLPPNAVLSALNLVPDIGTGSLETRKGYKRLFASFQQGYRIESLFAYNRLQGETTGQYVMLVMTDDLNDGTADNVQVWAMDLRNETVEQVSPPDKVWASSDARHWGAIIQGTFYGGGPGDTLYSWNPDAGWHDDPSSQDYPLLVDSTNPDQPSQVAFNFAFPKGYKVTYGGKAFSASRNNRFDRWKSGEDYKKGDKISHQRNWGTDVYWRSFEALKSHTASGANEPGSGGAGEWRQVNLPLPLNEDGDIVSAWDFVPEAAVTNLAVWHAERLFLRYDNVADLGKSRIQYSAPSKPRKGSDIGELHWDPKGFEVTPPDQKNTSEEGDGGGWLDVRTGDGDPITALWSFGYYLLIFKRRTSHVLAGTNEATWTLRDLAPMGCISSRAVTEHDGLVYFVSDEGFFQTDGTQVQEVPGAQNIRDWLRDAVNWESEGVDVDITLWSHKGFIWMSVPTGQSRTPTITIIYDPDSQSFWPTDLQVQAVTLNRIDGVSQMFFTIPTRTGSLVKAEYAWTGARWKSTSTRTVAGVVTTNQFKNPSFESEAAAIVQPFSGSKLTEWDGIWQPTDFVINKKNPSRKSLIDYRWAIKHKLRGKTAAWVKSNRKVDGYWEGLYQSFADPDTGAQTLSIYARMGSWNDTHREVTTKRVRLWVGLDTDQRPVLIDPDDHTIEYAGNGWYRVSATFTGDTVNLRPHGFALNADDGAFFDAAMSHPGLFPIPYFDGDGGDPEGAHGVAGGDWSLVFQYDHPDVRDIPQDDTGLETYEAQNIPWSLRTAWFSFGVLREERRIRRIWAQVRAGFAIVMRGFRNFDDALAFEADALPVDSNPVTHFEGRTMADSYSMSLGLESDQAPATIIGVAMETQPRRVRYHTSA